MFLTLTERIVSQIKGEIPTN